MKMEKLVDVGDRQHRFLLTMPDDLLMSRMAEAIPEEVVKVAGKAIAAEYVKANLPEILKHISPEAIATMTLAEAGAKVNEAIHKKFPDKILHTHTSSSHTEYEAAGFLSGILARIGL